MSYSDGMPILVHPDLAGVGNTIRASADTIWAELAALRVDVDNILAHWKGGANKYFVDLKAEWDFAANGLFNDVLGQVAHAMDVNWNNYVETEFANVRTWTAK